MYKCYLIPNNLLKFSVGLHQSCQRFGRDFYGYNHRRWATLSDDRSVLPLAEVLCKCESIGIYLYLITHLTNTGTTIRMMLATNSADLPISTTGRICPETAIATTAISRNIDSPLDINPDSCDIFKSVMSMGCRQVVRHLVLVQTFRGSNPCTPVKKLHS
jgi:hypothetical protein